MSECLAYIAYIAAARASVVDELHRRCFSHLFTLSIENTNGAKTAKTHLNVLAVMNVQ